MAATNRQKDVTNPLIWAAFDPKMSPRVPFTMQYFMRATGIDKQLSQSTFSKAVRGKYVDATHAHLIDATFEDVWVKPLAVLSRVLEKKKGPEKPVELSVSDIRALRGLWEWLNPYPSAAKTPPKKPKKKR